MKFNCNSRETIYVFILSWLWSLLNFNFYIACRVWHSPLKYSHDYRPNYFCIERGSLVVSWVDVPSFTKYFQVSVSLVGHRIVLISNYKYDLLNYGNEIMSSEKNSCWSFGGSLRQHLQSHDLVHFTVISFQEDTLGEVAPLSFANSTRN